MFSQIEMTDVLIGIVPIWAETETRLEWTKEKMRSREVEAVCTALWNHFLWKEKGEWIGSWRVQVV